MSPAAALIVQRDDGRYQIGIPDDAPGPFESRQFAEAVAIRGRAPPHQFARTEWLRRSTRHRGITP